MTRMQQKATMMMSEQGRFASVLFVCASVLPCMCTGTRMHVCTLATPSDSSSSNHSLCGAVQQAQGQKWCEKAEKGREKAQNQDFYGNKCRWKCGYPISSQMPSYLGKLLGRPRCFSTRKQHWAEQPVTVWSFHSSYGGLCSACSALIGSTARARGVPAQPLHYIKTGSHRRGFSLTARRISFIFSCNLSVRSSRCELFDSFVSGLIPSYQCWFSSFPASSSSVRSSCKTVQLNLNFKFCFYMGMDAMKQQIIVIESDFIASEEWMRIWYWIQHGWRAEPWGATLLWPWCFPLSTSRSRRLPRRPSSTASNWRRPAASWSSSFPVSLSVCRRRRPALSSWPSTGTGWRPSAAASAETWTSWRTPWPPPSKTDR